MADFNQAIKWLRGGKNVRRVHWQSWNGFHLENDPQIGLIFITGDQIYRNADHFSIIDIDAFDWEIFENSKISCSTDNLNLEFAKAKEAFILEELKPYFESGKICQEVKLRLAEIKDFKEKANNNFEEFVENLKKEIIPLKYGIKVDAKDRLDKEIDSLSREVFL